LVNSRSAHRKAPSPGKRNLTIRSQKQRCCHETMRCRVVPSTSGTFAVPRQKLRR
jgi:hypothetical protein